MTTYQNINQHPDLQCPQESPDHDDIVCLDPSHRIGCMYQTHDLVNVECWDYDTESDRLLAERVTETVGLAVARDWIVAQRSRLQRGAR